MHSLGTLHHLVVLVPFGVGRTPKWYTQNADQMVVFLFRTDIVLKHRTGTQEYLVIFCDIVAIYIMKQTPTSLTLLLSI
jgi:hypothetical protein